MVKQERDDVELSKVMKRLLSGERVAHEQLCEVLDVDPGVDHHVVARETLRQGCGLFVTQTDGLWWIDRAPWGGLATNTCPLCGSECVVNLLTLTGWKLTGLG